MNQVTVHKAYDDVSCLRLRLKGATEPHLYKLVITETTGYGKDNSKNGHDGQQGGIRQG